MIRFKIEKLKEFNLKIGLIIIVIKKHFVERS